MSSFLWMAYWQELQLNPLKSALISADAGCFEQFNRISFDIQKGIYAFNAGYIDCHIRRKNCVAEFIAQTSCIHIIIIFLVN